MTARITKPDVPAKAVTPRKNAPGGPAKAGTSAPNKPAGDPAQTAFEFLPDADEIERRPLPRVARYTLHVMLAAMVFFIVWASVSEIDLIVVARGKLVTPVPNIVVQPLETSIVQSIQVRPGQIVSKGDRLATLDPTFTQADASQLRTRMESLTTRLAAIEAELGGQRLRGGAAAAAGAVGAAASTPDRQIQAKLATERRASYSAQMHRQEETMGRLRISLETARQDEQALASRVKVLHEMEVMTEDLVNRKLAVKSRLLESRDRLLEATRSMELARNRQIELRREIAGIEAEKTSFESGWRQKLLEEQLAVSRDIDAVKDQLQKASRRQSMVVLTAPADAVVLEIAKLSQGSIVKEAETFFTLVPLGDVLEAEVQIESQDMGYVKVGAETTVKIDAYPFQKHGTMLGKLRTISQDAFRREGGAGAGAYYSGRVALETATLDRMPENGRLLPGMTMVAELKVGRRTVMSYLLWPLLKAGRESLREP